MSTKTRAARPFARYAHAYARQGYRVFPLRAGDKRPAVRGGYKIATTDPNRIDAWTRQPSLERGNIGLATGSGLVVIDVDPRNGGELDPSWPETLTVRTPSGGWHLYYAAPEGGPIRSSADGRIARGVDVRAEGGYVVAPGSVSAAGEWRWEDSNAPVLALPEPLARMALQRPGGAADGRHGGTRFVWPEEPHTIGRGQRHDWLVRAAGALAAQGAVTAAEMHSALRQEDAYNCVPPYADDEPRAFAGIVDTAEGWCFR